MKLKKAFALAAIALAVSSVFAETKAEELMTKAKGYEDNSRWVYAAGTYADIIATYPFEAAEAVKKLEAITKAWESGKPGLGKYGKFLQDDWEATLLDAEKYWSENCVYDLKISYPKETSIDSKTKTSTYSVDVTLDKSGYYSKYGKIMGALLEGYKAAYQDGWVPIDGQGFDDDYIYREIIGWPRTSSRKTAKERTTKVPEKSGYTRVKSYKSLYNWEPDVKAFPLATAASSYKKDGVALIGIPDYAYPNFNEETGSKYIQNGVSEYANAFTLGLYDLTLKITNEKGVTIATSASVTLDNTKSNYEGYNTAYTISFKGIKEADSILIDEGKAKVQVVSLNMKYGYIKPVPSWTYYRNSTWNYNSYWDVKDFTSWMNSLSTTAVTANVYTEDALVFENGEFQGEVGSFWSNSVNAEKIDSIKSTFVEKTIITDTQKIIYAYTPKYDGEISTKYLSNKYGKQFHYLDRYNSSDELTTVSKYESKSTLNNYYFYISVENLTAEQMAQILTEQKAAAKTALDVANAKIADYDNYSAFTAKYSAQIQAYKTAAAAVETAANGTKASEIATAINALNACKTDDADKAVVNAKAFDVEKVPAAKEVEDAQAKIAVYDGYGAFMSKVSKDLSSYKDAASKLDAATKGTDLEALKKARTTLSSFSTAALDKAVEDAKTFDVEKVPAAKEVEAAQAKIADYDSYSAYMKALSKEVASYKDAASKVDAATKGTDLDTLKSTRAALSAISTAAMDKAVEDAKKFEAEKVPAAEELAAAKAKLADYSTYANLMGDVAQVGEYQAKADTLASAIESLDLTKLVSARADLKTAKTDEADKALADAKAQMAAQIEVGKALLASTGLELAESDEAGKFLVTNVVAKSNASKGAMVNDLISVDGVSTLDGLYYKVGAMNPKDTLTFTYYRLNKKNVLEQKASKIVLK